MADLLLIVHEASTSNSVNSVQEYDSSSFESEDEFPTGRMRIIPDLNLNPKRKLSNEERQFIFEELLKQSDNGKKKHGSLSSVAALFSLNRKIVQRIWVRGIHCLEKENVVDVSRKFLQKSGRKAVQIELNKIAEIPLRNRTNIRSLSSALNMSTTSIHRRIKARDIRSHSSAIKPELSSKNKKERYDFCLSWLEQVNGGIPQFKDMMNIIHIDEKWFFMSKLSKKYYLLPKEQDPHRSCKSKCFIPKIMFMAAVARPRVNASNELFDGKIGIFPFIYKEPAKRNSKNRCVGTLETKPILSITKEVTRACLIEKVLPAICAKWPCSDSGTTIFI